MNRSANTNLFSLQNLRAILVLLAFATSAVTGTAAAAVVSDEIPSYSLQSHSLQPRSDEPRSAVVFDEKLMAGLVDQVFSFFDDMRMKYAPDPIGNDAPCETSYELSFALNDDLKAGAKYMCSLLMTPDFYKGDLAISRKAHPHVFEDVTDEDIRESLWIESVAQHEGSFANCIDLHSANIKVHVQERSERIMGMDVKINDDVVPNIEILKRVEAIEDNKLLLFYLSCFPNTSSSPILVFFHLFIEYDEKN
jgi:hypothetical protein